MGFGIDDIIALFPALLLLIQGIIDKDPLVDDDLLFQRVDDMVKLSGLAEVISDVLIRAAIGIARWIQKRKARAPA